MTSSALAFSWFSLLSSTISSSSSSTSSYLSSSLATSYLCSNCQPQLACPS